MFQMIDTSGLYCWKERIIGKLRQRLMAGIFIFRKQTEFMVSTKAIEIVNYIVAIINV